MNEQVGMNGEQGEGKSDNKKRVFLNEPLAYWYRTCKTGICNVRDRKNVERCQTEFKRMDITT